MEFELLRPKKITREILNLLNELSDTSKLPLDEARQILALQIDRQCYTYILIDNNKPVAIGSFLIIPKLIHNGSRVAQLEDICVSKIEQKKGYGRKLVNYLCRKAFQYNVYKIILNCSDGNVEFYKKCGFYKCGNELRRDK